MSIQEKIDKAIKDRVLYFVGDALPADFYAGFKIWLPLAEAGDTKAMVNVAYCYVSGEGVDIDGATGMNWYRKAASLGDTRAMLGLYARLKARQPAEAETFLQQAVAAGDGQAKEIVEERQRTAERAAKEAATAERARNAKERTKAALSDIKTLLGRHDVKAARQRAEEAVKDGDTWAGALLAVEALTITGHVTKSKRHHIVNGSSTSYRTVAGNFKTVADTYTTAEYQFKGEASNPTEYPCTVSLASGALVTVPAGGTVAFGHDHVGEHWKSSVTVFFKLNRASVDSEETYVHVPLSDRQFRLTGAGLGSGAGAGLSLKKVLWGGVGLLLLLWLAGHIL